MKFIKAKAGKLTIGDALAIAGIKIVEERVLSGVVGNGTLLSGGVKLVLAMMTKGFLGGKAGDLLGTSLMVDGAEDVISPLLSGGFGNIQLMGAGSGNEVI